MCGITGYFDLEGRAAEPGTLERMAGVLGHRGPDSEGFFAEAGVGLGFRRLAIIDLETGDQPLFNEDRSVVLIGSGEIFNYRELGRDLAARGHELRTRSDMEVLVHLYEEEGTGFLDRLNGQFAFALYDRRERLLFLGRDRFGVTPLHWAEADGVFLFGSEVKAILQHPAAPREVDLTGLDQVLCFPGLVPPRTVFRGISVLEGGHLLEVRPSGVREREYWDLVYPEESERGEAPPEAELVEDLRSRLTRAVEYRLQADVPVGFYLSGGLDSSLIGALIRDASNGRCRDSFSITFPDREISEAEHQRLMAGHLGARHHEIYFDWSEISDRLQRMVHHAECPVKESFNTCALALSEAARENGCRVVLAGQGADELFAGYVGYRFDQSRLRTDDYDLDAVMEAEIRERLWGDPDLFYELEFLPLREIKSALYAPELVASLPEFDCLGQAVVRGDRLRGRHVLHQRSYLDVKLRLNEHLLSEHGDRMVLASSVEGRYPFLDRDVVDLVTRLPPEMKLHGLVEKHALKEVARGLVPERIVGREKFGFRAPGTPYLLQQGAEWIEDLLSYERIKAQGYFDPDTVERLKTRYREPGFRLHPHLEIDLLMIVLTFGILVDRYDLPRARRVSGAVV